jgi:hypothetical protein
MSERAKIFVAGGCEPCKEIKEMAAAGKVDADIIDVATDEGFPFIEQLGISSVPVGYRDGVFCSIDIRDGEDGPELQLNCPDPPGEEADPEK